MGSASIHEWQGVSRWKLLWDGLVSKFLRGVGRRAENWRWAPLASLVRWLFRTFPFWGMRLLRPSRAVPPYPPYQKGPNFEPYFCEYARGKHFARRHIPILWSACYERGLEWAIQACLDGLDPKGKYFITCAHADAPKERVPPDTLVFSAGGKKGDIAIPIMRSPVPIEPAAEKDIFCSFVGSLTHPVRQRMQEAMKGRPGYLIETSDWTPDYADHEKDRFLDTLARSKFALCPRGYGPTSVRLYEAMELRAIPIYIGDTFWLPYTDVVDWESIALMVELEEIETIPERIEAMSEEAITAMAERAYRAYQKYFSLTAGTEHIARIVNGEVTQRRSVPSGV